MERTKWTPVTDPQEIEELTTRKDELDTPTFFAPNGHLWVDSEELKLWREGRDSTGP